MIKYILMALMGSLIADYFIVKAADVEMVLHEEMMVTVLLNLPLFALLFIAWHKERLNTTAK